MLNLGNEFRILEEVKVIGAGYSLWNRWPLTAITGILFIINFSMMQFNNSHWHFVFTTPSRWYWKRMNVRWCTFSQWRWRKLLSYTEIISRVKHVLIMLFNLFLDMRFGAEQEVYLYVVLKKMWKWEKFTDR